MIGVLKITGDSLFPLYKEGDFVIVSKIPFIFNRLKVGDVIVFNHSLHGTMIKMINEINQSGDKLRVIGTQEKSIDSRQFGEIDRSSITGKVIMHVRNPNFKKLY
jgi:nickel-type superoxide dismutase maturation protease